MHLRRKLFFFYTGGRVLTKWGVAQVRANPVWKLVMDGKQIAKLCLIYTTDTTDVEMFEMHWKGQVFVTFLRLLIKR